MFPDADIRIIDTRSVALGLGLMVCEAARMVRDGAGIDDVLACLDDMREGMNILFIVDTLEYLHKGGRIGRAAHLIGSMLDLKPVLAMRDGVVESHARYRTRRRSLGGLRDLVLESARGKSGLQLAIIHAVCEEEARQLADELREELKPDVFMFGENGPSIGVHAGPGTIGVCWYEPPG
jgi:DegV family protein with EDD domain